MTESQVDQIEIFDHGQISRMTFAPGWVEGKAKEFAGGQGTRSFREVHPLSAPEVMMCFYYRGLPCSLEVGQIFHQMLALSPHLVKDGDIKSIAEILRDKVNPVDFNMASARTEDLNGKRVLIVEGRYKQVQEDTLALFVDADGSGRAIQEIYFQAPKDQYLRYLKEAKTALKSIEWRD